MYENVFLLLKNDFKGNRFCYNKRGKYTIKNNVKKV